MDNDSRSLKAAFADAEKKRLLLQGGGDGHRLDTTSAAYRDVLRDAVKGYEECLERIRLASLFSSNESAEEGDLATGDLPYLFTDYHLADLVQRQPSSDPRARRHVLAAARSAYERFLSLSDSYGLLRGPHSGLWARYSDDPPAFTVAPAGADPAARREAKIANFRAERDLRQKLEFLRRRPEYFADPDADDLADSSSSGGGAGGAGTGDEDAVRSVHLAHLEYCAHMAFQALESLNREIEILAQAPQNPTPAAPPSAEDDKRGRIRGAGVAADGGYTDRLDGSAAGLRGAGPLLNGQGKPLRPFTLLGGGRQEMTRNVFRPSHNLPTMTIDEYLEEERRRGGIIDGGGEASGGGAPVVDEDDFDKADAETMKAREWDEFKEANPKGSGNTLNRG